jgi:hypothetical protein
VLEIGQAMSCIVKLEDPQIAVRPIFFQLGDLAWRLSQKFDIPDAGSTILLSMWCQKPADAHTVVLRRNGLIYWRFLRGGWSAASFSPDSTCSLVPVLKPDATGKLSLLGTAVIFMVGQSVLQYVGGAGLAMGDRDSFVRECLRRGVSERP